MFLLKGGVQEVKQKKIKHKWVVELVDMGVQQVANQSKKRGVMLAKVGGARRKERRKQHIMVYEIK